MVKANNNRADRGKNRKRGNVDVAPETREDLAKRLRIKPKTRAMVDLLIENPKLSQTEAYIQTHSTNNRKVASDNASKVLSKASVQIYKDSAVRKAKKRIVSLVDSNNENIALKASKDVLDRVEGKAVQKNESISRTVNVRLDLTGVKLGGHILSAPQIEQIEQG